MSPCPASRRISPPLLVPFLVFSVCPLVVIALALLISIRPPLVVIPLVFTSPDAVFKLTIPPASLNGCKVTFPPSVIPSGTVPLVNAGTKPELTPP